MLLIVLGYIHTAGLNTQFWFNVQIQFFLNVAWTELYAHSNKDTTHKTVLMQASMAVAVKVWCTGLC